MMEVQQQQLSTLRLDSHDSGISDSDETDRLTSSWSSACSPVAEVSDLVDSPFHETSESKDLSNVERITFDLAHDIVFYMSQLRSSKPPNTHAKILRKMALELCSRHEILFTSLVKKLELTQSNMDCQFIENVGNRMFSDKQYNWGRIVTFFAFAGWLARFCVNNNLDPDWSRKIADKTGNYVAQKLSPWIVEQGGWNAMEEFFREPDSLESKMWKGLLYTVLGLGALATAVAVVR